MNETNAGNGLISVTFTVEELLALADELAANVDPYEESLLRNAAYRVIEKAVLVEEVLVSYTSNTQISH